jgi:hypothetical protein
MLSYLAYRSNIMDWSAIISAITVIGFVYGFLRNFKNDINSHIDKIETRLDKRMDSLDERMFFMATGRKLEDAILQEKMKEK